ncbi:hypothetical protein LEMLEM_LOCUS766, partial [Lemmus lemmus]
PTERTERGEPNGENRTGRSQSEISKAQNFLQSGSSALGRPQDQQDLVWVPEHLTRRVQNGEDHDGQSNESPALSHDSAARITGTKMRDPDRVSEMDASSP